MDNSPEHVIESLGLELTHASKTAELLQHRLEIMTQERDAARLQLRDSLRAEEHMGLQLDKAERALAVADALLQRVANDICDSFTTRPEYQTLCNDIDAYRSRKRP
jgi:hypothetical protein